MSGSVAVAQAVQSYGRDSDNARDDFLHPIGQVRSFGEPDYTAGDGCRA
jgi:hypothetical protein